MAGVFPRLDGLKRVALDLLFPRWCLGCGKEGYYICLACQQTLTVINSPVCSQCGRPVSGGTLCPACAGSAADIDGIRSPFLFDGLVRKAVHEFKYNNLKALAPTLAAWLYEYLTRNPLPCDALVPVPLHPRRLRERGYNQSTLLARELGRLTGRTVTEGCLIRRAYTPPQVRSAGVEDRRRNVAMAFTCRDGRLSGKKVVLIDDVSTSGATLNACAAALKSAGAASVWGLVMALEE